MMVSGKVMRFPLPCVFLVSLGLLALGACQSTPKPAEATAPAKPAAMEKVDEAAKPEKKQEAAVEPQKKDDGQQARPTGFRWPWQKKPGKEEAAPKDDKAEAAVAAEELPSGDATPAATEETVKAAKPEKKRKAGLFAGFRWPWQKKPGREEAAPKGDKAEAAVAAEELPSGDATPAATEETVEAAKPEKKRKAGLFAGFRWPWQKKRPAGAELEGKTEPPPRDEGPPLPPVPDPGPIAPRAPEPGLAPADGPAPRAPKPDDPLSGIGLHPGT